MNRIGMLVNDGFGDDQVLETDIMRFMAIIGIVFWIIFSLVKSMPLISESNTLTSLHNSSVTQMMPNDIAATAKLNSKSEPSKAKEPKKAEPVHTQPIATKSDKTLSDKDVKTESEKKKSLPATPRKGLGIEFESLDAIFTLMKNQRVEIFGRAKATGFDLIFKAHRNADTIYFQSARSLPKKLWEIKDGDAFAYFIQLISTTFPSIQTFPEKQILVSFTDSGLDQKVESEFIRLQKENQNGILSVTPNGHLKFNSVSQTGKDGEHQQQGAAE